jgi:hypothetical protein
MIDWLYDWYQDHATLFWGVMLLVVFPVGLGLLQHLTAR